MNELPQTEILSLLKQMDPYEFEELVAAVWAHEGYETTVTQGSSDRGVDIEAINRGPYEQKDLIQAKRYSSGNAVGSEQVRRYATLYSQDPDADIVVIVTTSGFTDEAETLATDLNVKTIDGDQLSELIFDAQERFHPYLTVARDDASGEPETAQTDAPDTTTPTYFDMLQSEVRTFKDDLSGHKYGTSETLVMSFRDTENDLVTINFYYSKIYDNGVELGIELHGCDGILDETIGTLRAIEGVERVDLNSSNTIDVSTGRGDVSPECRILSALINKCAPTLSQGEELYFDEGSPEDGNTSSTKTDESVGSSATHSDSETDNAAQDNMFDIEKEFDEYR